MGRRQTSEAATRRGIGRRVASIPSDWRWFPGLLLLVALLLFAIPQIANDHVATGMGEVPERLVLAGFYPAERNAAGAYRWAIPSASLATSAQAPGTYRLALTLQEGPTGREPRVVIASINGRPRGEWALAPEPREFAVTVVLMREEWARSDRLVLSIDTAPLTIGGDPRSLGPVVSAFRLEQTAPPGPWPTPFLSACALVLLGGYPLLRLGGLSARTAAIALGLLGLGGAGYAALDRPGTLRLLHQPLADPAPLWLAGAGMAGVAALLLAERFPRPAWRSTALRDALFVAAIMGMSIAPYVARLGFYGDDWLFLKYLATAPQQTFGGLWDALWQNVPILRQRPVQMVSLIWLYQSAGSDPFAYHVVNGIVLTLAVVFLFLALRALGVSRPVALAVALTYGLLPQYSTDRFWIASWMAVQSQAAFAAAFYAGLMAVRRCSSRWLLGWGVAASLALLCSLLAYELVLPLLPLAGALIWWRGRRDGWSPRSLAGLLATQVGLVLLVLAYKSRVTIRATLGGTVDLLPTIARQLVKWDYGPYDVGLNARKAVEIGYGDLGLELPRTAWGLVDRYPSGGVVVVALALVLMIAAYLGRAGHGAADCWLAPKGWGGLIALGMLTFALGYAIFLTNTQIQFTVAGIANRVAIGATIGIALVIVGAVGWLCLAVPSRWRSRWFTAAVTLVCCCGFVICATLGEFWGDAAGEQYAILGAVRRDYAALPPGATLLLDGACPYVGPAQVFESAWDFAGALSVVYDDTAAKADIVTPRLTLEADHVATIIYGAIGKRYPYGPDLLVYDYERGTTVALTDRATAQQYFARVNPDRSNGCPPGIEGLGVRLLPWVNP